MLRSHSVRLNTALIGGALGLLALAGCQSDPSDTLVGEGGSQPIPTGSNVSSGSGGNGSGGDDNSSTTSSSASGSSSSTGGTTCEGQAATVQQISDGTIGALSKVKLDKVVAMSEKFLVYGSKTSCLWGVFVSAPDITTTAENTGLLVVSYGDNPTQVDNSMKCPAPAAANDKLPVGIKRGDTLTITGKTAAYLPSTCGGAANPQTCAGGGTQDNDPTTESVTKQIQLADVCAAEITGTATPPAPAVFTAAQVAELKKVDNQDFFNKWGSVKIRIQNTKAVLQTIGDINQPEGCFNKPITPDPRLDSFGSILLQEGLYVTNDLYYVKGATDVCSTGPWFADNAAELALTAVQGFVTLDYCTWKLYAQSPCDDYAPASTKCVAPTTTCF